MSKVGEEGQKVQTSSYKISYVMEYMVQPGDFINS